MPESLRRTVALVAGLVAIIVVIWIDVMTEMWQDFVIIAGLVAGAVTFLLTSLFIGRFIKRAERRRWAPVTRLALTELLHQLSEPDSIRISHGHAEPRQLPLPDTRIAPEDIPRITRELRDAVVDEHNRLAEGLVTWWALLSSIPDTEEIIQHTADVTLLLDSVRDASLELDDAIAGGATPARITDAEHSLHARVLTCNMAIENIVREISTRLEEDETQLSEKAQHALAQMHGHVKRTLTVKDTAKENTHD